MALLFSVITCATCGTPNYYDEVEENTTDEERAHMTAKPVQCRRCMASGFHFELPPAGVMCQPRTETEVTHG